MDKQDFIALIEKYLAGETSEEEDQALFNYYQSFQRSGSHWDESLLGRKEDLEERLLNRFHNETGIAKIVPLPQRSRFGVVKIAACLLGILLAGSLLFRNSIIRFLHPVQELVVVTASGERRAIILADHSKLWLEPESKLIYPDHFTGPERGITLKGSAFFDVTKDKDHPFVIHSDSLRTQVLGTSFYIQSGSYGTQVSVITGQVSVRLEQEHTGPAREITLSPNQQALYSIGNGTLIEKDNINAGDYLYRREGRYIYKGEKVKIVLEDLARCFKNNIQIRGQVADCAFYGSFATDGESLGKIMELIAVSLNAKILHNTPDSSYVLSGGPCE